MMVATRGGFTIIIILVVIISLSFIFLFMTKTKEGSNFCTLLQCSCRAPVRSVQNALGHSIATFISNNEGFIFLSMAFLSIMEAKEGSFTEVVVVITMVVVIDVGI